MSVVKGVLDSTRGVNFSSKKNLVVLHAPRVESSLKPGDLCPLFAGGGWLQHYGGKTLAPFRLTLSAKISYFFNGRIVFFSYNKLVLQISRSNNKFYRTGPL